MFLSIMSFISIISTVIMPIRLSSNVNEESSALIFTPSNQREELGYNRYYKNLVEGITDDSGCVHILIKEEYTGLKLNWIYQKYNYEGIKIVDKILYSAEYGKRAYDYIYARLLMNPDMTILFIYPDNDFYTCWMKLDRAGDIIEENQPMWWRGDAQFCVCSAGQDSFHIISDPLTLWAQPPKYYDPELGWREPGVKGSKIPHLYYSNNFK